MVKRKRVVFKKKKEPQKDEAAGSAPMIKSALGLDKTQRPGTEEYVDAPVPQIHVPYDAIGKDEPDEDKEGEATLPPESDDLQTDSIALQALRDV